MTPRETIYQALMDLLVDPEIKTLSRRLKHWSEVPPGDQPALFITQKLETAKFTTRMPTSWVLSVDLWLYVNTGGDSDKTPMSIVNPILDRIVQKLLPASGVEEQTLGGLVERCRIDGAIETDEGVLGDQAIITIPVTMLVI